MSITADETTLEDRIRGLERQLKEIQEVLDFVKATIVKADTTITTVADQVMPTVNDLMNSPMLKMLGMKKK
jgi:uncharacterized coiled-coil protein SlyX